MNLYVRLLGEPPMPPADADFVFDIKFAKAQGDPRRVFDAASLFIEGLEELDETIIGSVDSNIRTLMVLEDVEAGSLRVFLKTVLQSLDDQGLKDGEWKKAIGPCLVQAKYLAIEALDNDKSDAPNVISDLQKKLQEITSQTDIRHLPSYAPIHTGRLVASLDKIQDAKRTLEPGDGLIIETDGKRYEVDLTKTWEPAEAIDVPDTEETHSEGEIILTIRKPDVLGVAKWQFRHGKNPVSAPLKDEQWLRDFHERKIPLYSGDALKCKVRFTYVYDDKGTLIDQKIEIIKVVEVIPGGNVRQTSLFDSDGG